MLLFPLQFEIFSRLCCSLVYHLCKSPVFCWNVSQIAYEVWIRVFVSFSFKIFFEVKCKPFFYNYVPSNQNIIIFIDTYIQELQDKRN